MHNILKVKNYNLIDSKQSFLVVFLIFYGIATYRLDCCKSTLHRFVKFLLSIQKEFVATLPQFALLIHVLEGTLGLKYGLFL